MDRFNGPDHLITKLSFDGPYDIKKWGPDLVGSSDQVLLMQIFLYEAKLANGISQGKRHRFRVSLERFEAGRGHNLRAIRTEGEDSIGSKSLPIWNGTWPSSTLESFNFFFLTTTPQILFINIYYHINYLFLIIYLH